MRGKRAKKRKVQLDPKYGDDLMARFINKIMLHGKRGTAEQMFYDALEAAAKKVGVDPLEFLNTMTDNVRPALEIKARRVGGANYQVPVPVSPTRQETLVIRWMVDVARSKTGDSFTNILMKEMLDAYNGTGDVARKKEDTERMAEANKAFSHFRF